MKKEGYKERIVYVLNLMGVERFGNLKKAFVGLGKKHLPELSNEHGAHVSMIVGPIFHSLIITLYPKMGKNRLYLRYGSPYLI
jgi:hypothetical protein